MCDKSKKSLEIIRNELKSTYSNYCLNLLTSIFNDKLINFID